MARADLFATTGHPYYVAAAPWTRTSAGVKALHLLADRFLLDRLQGWRRR